MENKMKVTLRAFYVDGEEYWHSQDVKNIMESIKPLFRDQMNFEWPTTPKTEREGTSE